MNKHAIEGLTANYNDLTTVLESLNEDEWQAASACAGWRVQDVISHTSSTLKLMVDPDPPAPDDEPLPSGAEDMAEALVAPRKSWTSDQVLAEFLQYRDPFIAAQTALQDEPLASTETSLGELGTHPLRILAGTFAFDAYCHLRHDIVAPGGPIERDLPPADDLRLLGGIEWMMFGLPQMCEAPLGPVLRAPMAFEFTGPGASTYVISPNAEGPAGVTEIDGASAAVATVTSSAHDFVSWGTQRSNWREQSTVSGDTEMAAAVLDVVNVI
jgi:uncharacterized protein (TIGR03083 family)